MCVYWRLPIIVRCFGTVFGHFLIKKWSKNGGYIPLMGVYREGPKMRSLLEGSRKARESCRAILTFDRQKGGPKMSQNVSYFDILGFQKVGHKMWSTRSTRLLRVWGTPKSWFLTPFLTPFWTIYRNMPTFHVQRIPVLSRVCQKGSQNGSKGSKNPFSRARAEIP